MSVPRRGNSDLCAEQVEIILKAFHQRAFFHHSKRYDLPPQVPYRGYMLEALRLVPRPQYLPVECWQPIVSASQQAIEFYGQARYQRDYWRWRRG